MIVNLSKDLEKRIGILSDKLHKSKELFLQEALENYMEDQEDYLMASAAVEEQKKSGEPFVPFEKIVKKMKDPHV